MYVELSPDRVMHKHLEVCIITQEALSITIQAHLVTGRNYIIGTNLCIRSKAVMKRKKGGEGGY